MRNQQLILKNSNLGFLGKNKKLRNELLELQEKLKKNRLEIMHVSLKNSRKHVFRDKNRLLNKKHSSRLKLKKLKSLNVKLTF
jgi:hypothetical protein